MYNTTDNGKGVLGVGEDKIESEWWKLIALNHINHIFPHINCENHSILCFMMRSGMHYELSFSFDVQ
ncbi:unnamed protein product [Prunus brigantina]